MKNSWEWDEKDLLELVKASTQESIELDFKESPSLQNTEKKKDEISKDVSAFANSAGGTLLYGMKEDKQTHVATGIDAGSDPKVITKEWLEQVINSNIHQRIDGVRIHQIELTTTKPGHVAYVVYVPFSTRTPHQAANKKFYKRFNFESVPMEEYEVRDLYRRAETPDLRIEFTLSNDKPIFNQEATEFEPFGLIATIANDAPEPANYAVIKLFIDERLTIVSAKGLTVHNGLAFSFANTSHRVRMLRMNWGIPGKLPIFDEPFRIADEPIKLKIPSEEQGKEKVYLLGYEIKSPRMTVKQRFSLLSLKNDMMALSESYLSGEEVDLNYDELGFGGLPLVSPGESHI